MVQQSLSIIIPKEAVQPPYVATLVKFYDLLSEASSEPLDARTRQPLKTIPSILKIGPLQFYALNSDISSYMSGQGTTCTGLRPLNWEVILGPQRALTE